MRRFSWPTASRSSVAAGVIQYLAKPHRVIVLRQELQVAPKRRRAATRQQVFEVGRRIVGDRVVTTDRQLRPEHFL